VRQQVAERGACVCARTGRLVPRRAEKLTGGLLGQRPDLPAGRKILALGLELLALSRSARGPARH
jgi:hypothetical protein